MTAYFRGRKLYAKSVKIPKGYKGVVVSSTEKTLPKEPAPPQSQDDEVEAEEEEIEVGIMEELAGFDEVMVWGHEVVVDEKEDPYARGIQEWMKFADAVSATIAAEYDELMIADARVQGWWIGRLG